MIGFIQDESSKPKAVFVKVITSMRVLFLKCDQASAQNVFSLRKAISIISLFCYANLSAQELTLEPLNLDEIYSSEESSVFEEAYTGAELHASTQSEFWRNSVNVESFWKSKSFFKSQYTERLNSLKYGETRTAAFDISMDIPMWGDSVSFKSNIRSGKFKSFDSVFVRDVERYSVNENLMYPGRLINSPYDVSDGLINLALQANSGDFGYGVEYNRVGKLYKRTRNDKGFIRRDREGFDYWVSKKWSDFSVKSGYSDTWNNINLNPTQMRYNEQVFKVSSSYVLSNWPYSSVTLDYKSGNRFSSYTPNGKKPYTGTISSFGASFYFSYNRVDFSLGSFLEYYKNALNPEDRSQTLTYYFSGGYSPIDSLYIYPSISYSTSKMTSNGSSPYRFDSVDTSLSISYTPKDLPINVSYYLSHNKSNSNSGYTDSSTIYNILSLEWVMSTHHKKKESALRFELEQASYQDQVYDSLSYSDLYLGVRWVYSFN